MTTPTDRRASSCATPRATTVRKKGSSVQTIEGCPTETPLRPPRVPSPDALSGHPRSPPFCPRPRGRPKVRGEPGQEVARGVANAHPVFLRALSALASSSAQRRAGGGARNGRARLRNGRTGRKRLSCRQQLGHRERPSARHQSARGASGARSHVFVFRHPGRAARLHLVAP